MQDYFGGKVASEITPDRVCCRVFLFSWGRELSLTKLYNSESEPRCSKEGFAETPATTYLTQWVMAGSSPRLVLYDCGSNTNMIQREVAENQELKILSGRAGRIKVAGREYVSTGFGSYKATLGPSRSGRFYNLKCQGIKEITGNLVEHPLKEINKELRDAEMIDVDTPSRSTLGESTWESSWDSRMSASTLC